MHPLDMIREWRKGCANTIDSHPSNCAECTESLVNALERRLQSGIQSKRASLSEAVINTVVGFILSFSIQKILNYAYNVEMSNSTAAWFVFWFTVASIVRSYVLRRIYNREMWRKPSGD